MEQQQPDFTTDQDQDLQEALSDEELDRQIAEQERRFARARKLERLKAFREGRDPDAETSRQASQGPSETTFQIQHRTQAWSKLNLPLPHFEGDS